MNEYGMKNVSIEETSNNTFVVKADTKRFGFGEIMFESYSFGECIAWLKKNGIKVEYIKIDAPKAIRKIVHESFCIDSYDIEFIDGFRQYKTSRYELTNAEEDFMWDRRMNRTFTERWIKNGGLLTEYVA